MPGRTYITSLFENEGAANRAKAALAALKDVTVHRAIVIHRDRQGFRVDGRYAGEPPHTWVALLETALARIVLGVSREEDGVAVSDAEANWESAKLRSLPSSMQMFQKAPTMRYIRLEAQSCSRHREL